MIIQSAKEDGEKPELQIAQGNRKTMAHWKIVVCQKLDTSFVKKVDPATSFQGVYSIEIKT